MSLQKPLIRTIRQLIDGSYRNDGNWLYLLHPKYANDPQHYIRAFLIIQEDLKSLFEFVEPCDQNLNTISLKIHELLTRVCIEIEANFTAILKENKYSNTKNWNLKDDYFLIEFSHKLSAYKVKFPIWKGKHHTRNPFKNWGCKPTVNRHILEWYQVYNKSKHDRHTYFAKATLKNLLDAVAGLVVLLSAQFMDEDYSLIEKGRSIGGAYSYDYNPQFESAIGSYFRVQYPKDWSKRGKYGFNWQELQFSSEPFDKIDFDKIKNNC